MIELCKEKNGPGWDLNLGTLGLHMQELNLLSQMAIHEVGLLNHVLLYCNSLT
jgi:hypothetical protein